MGKIIICLLIALVFFCRTGWAEEALSIKEVPYPETKYYQESYEALKKQENFLDELYLKKPEPNEEVDLKKIDSTFFTRGTKNKKIPDYLSEAEKESWIEWSPVFYEFGKAFKKEGKKLFYQWFFPKKTEFERTKE